MLTPPAMDLKPRHYLPLRITQRPLTPRPLRPHPVDLPPREPPRLNRSIIPQPARPRPRPLHPNLITHPAISAFINRHHGRPPKAQVMLQRHPRPRHQPIRRPPPKLPHQLRTLRQPARAQRMSLRYKPAGRIDDAAPAEGDIPLPDHLVGLSPLTQPQGVKRDELVGGEAVVQLADADVRGGDARLGHCGCGGVGAHAVTDEGDAARVEEVGGVGREGLAGHEDGLGAEMGPLLEEGFGDDDGGGGAVAGGAALKFGEGVVDHGTGLDLFQSVDVAELAVGVLGRVEMVDPGYLCEVSRFGAVVLHVLPARIAKQLRRAGGVRDAARLRHHRI